MTLGTHLRAEADAACSLIPCVRVWARRAVVLALVCAGAFACLHRIGSRSLWEDETYMGFGNLSSTGEFTDIRLEKER